MDIKKIKKEYGALIVSLIVLVIIGVITSILAPYKEAKEYCGDITAVKLVKEEVYSKMKSYANLLTLLNFGKQVNNVSQNEINSALDYLKDNATINGFKILKQSKDRKHFYCEATVRTLDVHGFEKKFKVDYYVRYFTKNGEEWVQVDLAQIK